MYPRDGKPKTDDQTVFGRLKGMVDGRFSGDQIWANHLSPKTQAACPPFPPCFEMTLLHFRGWPMIHFPWLRNNFARDANDESLFRQKNGSDRIRSRLSRHFSDPIFLPNSFMRSFSETKGDEGRFRGTLAASFCTQQINNAFSQSIN